MKQTVLQRFWMYVLFLVIIFACVYLIATGIYGVDLRPRAVLYQLLDPPGHDHIGVSKRFIVQELSIIHNQLAKAIHIKKPPDSLVLEKIEQLIKRIEPEYGLDMVADHGILGNVCPERAFRTS